jgi:hypothetical protein
MASHFPDNQTDFKQNYTPEKVKSGRERNRPRIGNIKRDNNTLFPSLSRETNRFKQNFTRKKLERGREERTSYPKYKKETMIH